MPETTRVMLRRIARQWLIFGLVMLAFLAAVGAAQVVWEITQHV